MTQSRFGRFRVRLLGLWLWVTIAIATMFAVTAASDLLLLVVTLGLVWSVGAVVLAMVSDLSDTPLELAARRSAGQTSDSLILVFERSPMLPTELSHLFGVLSDLDRAASEVVYGGDALVLGGFVPSEVRELRMASPLVLELVGPPTTLALIWWIVKHPRTVGAWPKLFMEGFRNPDSASAEERRLVDSVVSAIEELRRRHGLRDAQLPNPSSEQEAFIHELEHTQQQRLTVARSDPESLTSTEN